MGRKIVIDCRMIQLSGIGRYLKELLNPILEAFPTTTLLGEQAQLASYQKQYPNISIVSAQSPIYSIQEQIEYAQKISSCDVFWSPHFNIPLVPIKARKRLVTVHDAYHLAFYEDLSRFQKLYAKLFFNQALSRSDQVITVSQFSKEELLKYTSTRHQRKIEVIHNGVSEIGATRPSGEVKTEPPYFLYVGNVKPHKNLKRAIRAFQQFITQYPAFNRIQFKIVGKKDGFINSDDELQALLVQDPILSSLVHFTGYVSDDDLNRYYQQALCLVFPSYYEGFGFPPLEAMKLNCPSIVSSAASLPEVCGDAVLYFDPYSIDDMAAQMHQVASSTPLRQTLIRKGQEQIVKFSWSEAAQKHIHLLNSLV